MNFNDLEDIIAQSGSIFDDDYTQTTFPSNVPVPDHQYATTPVVTDPSYSISAPIPQQTLPQSTLYWSSYAGATYARVLQSPFQPPQIPAIGIGSGHDVRNGMTGGQPPSLGQLAEEPAPYIQNVFGSGAAPVHTASRAPADHPSQLGLYGGINSTQTTTWANVAARAANTWQQRVPQGPTVAAASMQQCGVRQSQQPRWDQHRWSNDATPRPNNITAFHPEIPESYLRPETHANPRSVEHFVENVQRGRHRHPLPSGGHPQAAYSTPPATGSHSITSNGTRRSRQQMFERSDAFPFPCDRCGKYFSSIGHAQKHMTRYCTESPRPLVCTFPGCFRRFNFPRELTRHRISGHGNPDNFSSFRCGVLSCPKEFNRSDNRDRHERNVHNYHRHPPSPPSTTGFPTG